MKQPSLLSFFACLAVCGHCAAIAVYAYFDSPPLPPLLAEPVVIDFGDIQGQYIVHGTSKIKNTTKKPIQIIRVVVSCTCGDVTLKQGEFLPGATTELSAAWNVHGRSGTTSESFAIVYVLDGQQ